MNHKLLKGNEVTPGMLITNIVFNKSDNKIEIQSGIVQSSEEVLPNMSKKHVVYNEQLDLRWEFFTRNDFTDYYLSDLEVSYVIKGLPY